MNRAPMNGAPMLGRRRMLRLLATAPIALAFAPLAGCRAEGPRAIRIGEEECAHCRMRISDERFAAQLASDRGRSWAFDSVECLVEWTLEESELPRDRIAGWWVTDFENPGSWLDAARATYLRSDALRSPMGLGLSAWADAPAARAQQGAHGGDVLDWDEVRALVASTTVRGGHGGMRGGAGAGPGSGERSHGH
jgi:copper chaperone NosL